MMGAVAIQQAALNTERNLLGRIPPIATIIPDWRWTLSTELEEMRELSENTTREILHQIGTLSHVSTYNITLDSSLPLRSQDLVRNTQLSIDLDNFGTAERWRIVDHSSAEHSAFHQDKGENFFLRGIYFTDKIADFYFGLMALSEGRIFTSEELKNGEPVALISRQFARANGLTIGSSLNLTNYVHYWGPPLADSIHYWGSLLSTSEVYLEIIGIFDLDTSFFDYENNFYAFADEFRQTNLIHTPLAVVERLERENFEIVQAVDTFLATMEFEESVNYHSIYILESPRLLHDFIEEASNLVPPNWIAEGVSTYVFGSLEASLDSLMWIMDTVLYGTIIASLVITSLLILLFCRDRREEIGIYLALGKKKSRIFAQIILEVAVVSIIALTLSTFSGQLLSGMISQQMLTTELARYEQERINAPWGTMMNPHNLLIYSPPRMSMEEMAEAFEVSISPTAIRHFYLVGMGTVLLSTLLPIAYLTRLDPKKILM